MAIIGSIPVLYCLSIKQTLSFYQQLLQFVIVNKREKGDELKWVHLMHADTSLMLQSQDGPNTDPLHAHPSKIKLYFYVNNINELYHYIKVKYNDVSELVNTDYNMREFWLTDPEGNMVVLGQQNAASDPDRSL